MTAVLVVLLITAAVLWGLSVLWQRIRSRETYTNSVGMVMVRLPAREFVMGSTPEERDWGVRHGAQPGWVRNEAEAHVTAIEQPFWIGETEVTVKQFSRFIEATGYRTCAENGALPLTWDPARQEWAKQEGRSWRNPGLAQTNHSPASCIAWPDAKAFCAWLNRQEKNGKLIPKDHYYRLPSEREWEYACRAGARTRFSWGEEAKDARYYANIVDHTPLPDGQHWAIEHAPWEDGFALVAPVARFRPNAFGLYDMHGNLWEWCENDAFKLLSNTTEDGRPITPRKVLRGGSWDNSAGNLRCAVRRDALPDFSSSTTGFRVVLVKEERNPRR
jgi:sulfatase modifying factor 1